MSTQHLRAPLDRTKSYHHVAFFGNSVSAFEAKKGKRHRSRSTRPDGFKFSKLRAADVPVVLVVDDDADARLIYSTYLRAKGCEVYVARDGLAAIEKAVDLLPDIIVMDLAMPRVDGWEAIRRLRESSWTREIPIVAVSAVPISRETAFDAGCDAYLTKPCEPHVVWSQIGALLKRTDRGPTYG